MSIRTVALTTILCLSAGTAVALAPHPFRSAHAGLQDGKITPEMGAELDKFTKELATWADSKAIVEAVQSQNKVGPLADMTEAKWKEARRRTPLIDAFQQNPAGAELAKRASATNGFVCEAFLSAAKGEKVAFIEKTTSYIHKGKPKFDVPFTTGKPWRGESSFDESTQSYSVQVSLPVFEPKVAGAADDAARKTIGVLTVGVDLAKLAERAKASIQK